MALKIGEEPVPGYRLVKFLGRGGFGQVWQATSPGGIHVALKLIDLGGREGVKEFKALRLMKSVRQANLTPILAFWLKDEDGYLVDEAQVSGDLAAAGQSALAFPSPQGTMMMGSISKMRPSELIIAMGLGDKTLSDRLRECQKQGLEGIPAEELFNYMLDAARAIDFLNTPRHDLGNGPVSPIQHCDIKPQNILIVGDTAQVCDFGLARELGANVKMTSAAVSPAYGAPELIEGQPPSPATDQYSLAITYVELRTGSLPFADPDSYLHVVNAHLQSALDLSNLSIEEQEIIRKATLRDPSQRFESALRMVKALRQACPEEFGSKLAMPRGRRGSDSEVDSRQPFLGQGDSKSGTGMPTTETPSSRGFVTKVDPPGLASTQPYATDEQVAAGRRKRLLGRLIKSAAAVAALMCVAVLGWKLVPEPEEPRALRLANDEIINATTTDDDLEKARLLASAVKLCQPFRSKSEFVEVIDKARAFQATVLQAAEKKAQGDLDKIKELADDSARIKPLKDLLFYCDQFAALLPDADKLSERREQAHRWLDEIELEKRRNDQAEAQRLVDGAEQALDAPSNTAGALADLIANLAKAQALVDPSKEAADVGFRARLAAARAQARGGQLPPARQLDDLWVELESLPQIEPKSKASSLKAQLAVLRALASKRDTPTDPQAALERLDAAAGPRESLARHEWEAAQFDALLDWADKSVPADAQPSKLTGLLRRLRPPLDVAELRATALAQWQARDLPALARTLGETERAKPTGPDAQIFHELSLLSTLVASSTPKEQVDSALDELDKLLASRNVVKLVDLASALAELGQAQPARVARALDLAANALGQEQIQEQKDQITQSMRGLYNQRIAQFIAEPSAAERQPYFQELHELAEQARQAGSQDPLVALALAESLIELDAGDRDKIVAETRDIWPREDSKLDSRYTLYKTYVRLRRDQETGETATAQNAETDLADVVNLAANVRQNPPAAGLAVEHRRRGVAGLFVYGASKLRAPTGARDLTVSAVLAPYGKDGEKKAEQAFKWLLEANELAPEVQHDPMLRAEFILSTWYKSGQDKEKAKEVVLKAYKGLEGKVQALGTVRWPLRYVYCLAQPESPQGFLEATRVRADLADALSRSSARPADTDVLDLYSALIAPPLAKVAKTPATDTELKQLVSRLAYRKGRLVDEYRSAPWPFDPRAEEYKAFDLAVTGDPNNAEYLAARGFAGLHLEPPRIDTAMSDAKKLVTANSTFPGSFGLLAKASLAEARYQHDPAKRAALAETAVKSGIKAVELSRRAAKSGTEDRTSLVLYLLDLGESYVAAANYSGSDHPVPRAERLKAAIDSIKEAQRINTGGIYADVAYLTLGNAYEDLASIATVDVTANYNRAIEAFTEARQTAPEPSLALMSLGRCYYKREAESGQPGLMAKAEEALKEATQKRAGFAEAHRWLAWVYRFNKDYNQADEHIERAMNLAKQQNSNDAPAYTLLWTQVRLADPDYDQNKVRERVARAMPELADAKLYRQQLAWTTARSFEIEAENYDAQAKARSGNVKLLSERLRDASRESALQTYNKALPDDLSTTDAADLDLLRGRAALNRLRVARPEDLRATVNDSDRIIQLTASSPLWTDLRSNAQLYGGLAEQNQQTGSERLLERAIAHFDRAVDLAPQEPATEVRKLLDEYVVQLHKSVTEPNLVRQLTPKARQIVKQAPAALRNKIEKLAIDSRAKEEFIDRRLSVVENEIRRLP